MSVTCPQLVEATEKLAASADCEADWRAVCARSYYSIYHAGKAFWEGLNAEGYPGSLEPEQRPGRHVDLYTRLKNPTLPKIDPRHKLSWRLGLMMMNLHSQRTTADYFLDETIDQVAAANGVVTAANVLALLDGKAFGAPVAKFDGATSEPGADVSPASSFDVPPAASSAIQLPRQTGGLKVVKRDE